MKASAAVWAVEVKMLAGLTETEQSAAFRILTSMVLPLRDDMRREARLEPPVDPQVCSVPDR